MAARSAALSRARRSEHGPASEEKYVSEIREALRAEFKHENVMQVGGLTKIVVNMGVGEAARDSKALEGAIRDLTGDHRPEARDHPRQEVHRAVQAARGPGDRCARHASRRPHVGVPGPPGYPALPRIRDFRGLSDRQFDGNGNYTFGLTVAVHVPRNDQSSIDRVRGMDITVVTSAKTDEEGRAILKALGFPFKTN